MQAFEAELVWRSRQLMEHMGQLARGAAGEAAAMEIARAVELQQQAGAASAAALRTLDAKLAAVEGSVLSTGAGEGWMGAEGWVESPGEGQKQENQ